MFKISFFSLPHLVRKERNEQQSDGWHTTQISDRKMEASLNFFFTVFSARGDFLCKLPSFPTCTLPLVSFPGCCWQHWIFPGCGVYQYRLGYRWSRSGCSWHTAYADWQVCIWQPMTWNQWHHCKWHSKISDITHCSLRKFPRFEHRCSKQLNVFKSK